MVNIDTDTDSDTDSEVPIKKYKKHIAGFFIIVLVFVLIFYYSLIPTEGDLTGDMSEDEFSQFIDMVNESNENIEGYSFDVILDMNVDNENRQMSYDGDVNIKDKEARLFYDLDSFHATSNPLSPPQEFRLYYNETHVFMEDDNWIKQDIDEFDEQNNLDDNTEFNSGNEFWDVSQHTNTDMMYHYGDVKITNNTDYIEIKTELENNEMRHIINENSNNAHIDSIGSPSFDNVTIYESYDAETYNLKEYKITTVVSESDISAELNLNMDMYNYTTDIDNTSKDINSTIPINVHEKSEYDNIRF